MWLGEEVFCSFFGGDFPRSLCALACRAMTLLGRKPQGYKNKTEIIGRKFFIS